MPSRRNPFEEIEQMFDRLSRQFEEEPFGLMGMAGSIAVDVADHDDEFVVTADLPGFDKDDIDVSLADRTLQIEADHEEEETEESADYLRRERNRQSMSRSLTLPESVDQEGISASLNNGVLTVTLPKREQDGGHRIDIE